MIISIYSIYQWLNRNPLVMTDIATEHADLWRGFIHWKWWFSIVMLTVTWGWIEVHIIAKLDTQIGFESKKGIVWDDWVQPGIQVGVVEGTFSSGRSTGMGNRGREYSDTFRLFSPLSSYPIYKWTSHGYLPLIETIKVILPGLPSGKLT